MARKDGFPTNHEMQVDLTTAAHGVFVSAFEREIGSDASPEYQDKPLSLLEFRAWKNYKNTEGTPQTVQREQLLIAPISEWNAGLLIHNELFRDASGDVLARYQEIATGIARLSIDPSLRLRDQLPPEGVDFDYTAGLTDGRERHASTFRERSAKQSLAAAGYLAEEVADYVRSDEFDIPRRARAIAKAMGTTGIAGDSGIEHVFSFKFDPSLPLNGHESQGFIRKFSSDMFRRLRASEKKLVQFRTMEFIPELFIEQELKKRQSYEDAYNNSLRFL